jgi:hypothetical protein
MAQITEKLTQLFGGQAEAANQGVGSIKGLKVAFDNLEEAIGEKFAESFTAAVKKMTEFFRYIEENDALVALAAGVLAGGAALAGLVSILATVSIAFVAATAAAAAFEISIAAFLIPLGIAAAAIVAISAGAGMWALKTREVDDSVAGVTKRLEEAKAKIDELKQAQQRTWNPDDIAAYADDIKLASREVDILKARLEELRKGPPDDPKLAAKRKLAQQAEEEQLARQAREQAALRSHLGLLKLQEEGASAEIISLAQNEATVLEEIADVKNKSIQSYLHAELEQVRNKIIERKQMEMEEQQLQLEKNVEVQEQLLSQNREFAELDAAEQAEFIAANQDLIQKQYLTAEQVRKKATTDRLTQQIQENNLFIANQQKFGTAYATINKIMHSEIYNGTKSASQDLAALQTSSNSTLKGIGKAAALANIAMKTAESAMNIFDGFSTIPIIGPALGIAGAAAAVLFGAEQASKVTAAADGGLIQGPGGPLGDRIPALLSDGEVVVPARNFDETVGAVAASRANDGQTGGIARVILEMKGNLSEFIQAEIVEQQSLGISILRGA